MAPWPDPHPEHRDAEAETRFAFAEQLVTAIRRFRKAHGLRDSLSLSARVSADGRRLDDANALRAEIERLANVSTLDVLDGPGDPTGCARVVIDGADVLIPLAGVLDPDAERDRLGGRLAAIETDAARHRAKLANQGFMAKAPPEIVDKERRRLAALEDEAAALRAQLDELA